jgi:hypothetical protein
MAAIDNPFAVLTAVVAPAILTNACSVLSLATANRVARVVDQTRVISAALEDLAAGDRKHGYYTSQLARQRERGHLLVRALRLFYYALGAFAASALIAVVGSALTVYDFEFGFHTAAAIGLMVGATAVISLVAGCALMIRETRLAIANMTEAAKINPGTPPDSEL